MQTVESWEPPSVFADAPMAAIVAVLDRLTKGPRSGEQYTLRGNSGDRWAEDVVIGELNKTEEEAKKMLAIGKSRA